MYKLKLSTKWKIYNVFHVLLLEQDTTKKEQVNQNNAHTYTLPESEKEFKFENNKEYKVTSIPDIIVYGKKAEN